MMVRGFHWLAYLASTQLRRPVIGGERSDKSRPNVYKLSIESHQWRIDLRELLPRKFHSNKHETLTTILRKSWVMEAFG